MINPRREWTAFESIEDKLEKLRQWKLISPKAVEVKQLYYKGDYTDKPIECDVVGFVDDNEIIIYISGELHSIHPDYLVDMQNKSFSRYLDQSEEVLKIELPKVDKESKKEGKKDSKKVTKKENFIIVDIETPHSFMAKDGIREVAALVVEDYKVVDSIHLAIVNDEEKYKSGYGSGLEAIEENSELKNQFKGLIEKYQYPIVAHNASFDKKFLAYWGWVDDSIKFYCSMNTIKSKVKLDSYKLVELLKHYNIKGDQTHTAMQDVLDLLELLKVVKPQKWSVLTATTNSGGGKTRNYEVDKDKRAEEKLRLEAAKGNIIENIFDSKKLVFTGDMSKSRCEMMEMAIHYGAVIASSVSKKTDLIVMGTEPGKSKIAKAEELGITMISEEGFFDIINKK
ncbi:MAG: BRCT domain-containing protein [Clostridium sp.]|uniref:BRCT domain-containing protein n=1 Tax=Clostridium sp. TaxID=1506 RepID=UPI0030557E01